VSSQPAGLDGVRLDGVRLGEAVSVRVPASSANLGPGFDSLGLALDVVDHVVVEAYDPRDVEGPGSGTVQITVDGAGGPALPLDESHLVVRMVRAGLAHAGAGRPGLRLHCRNAIPHSRGLGSSSAAIVAGLVAARGLLYEPHRLDHAAVFDLASAVEGHPDNAAATLFGGFTLAWTEPASALPRARAVRLDVDPAVRVVVCLPPEELATSRARAMLPAHVPHADAAFNAGRAALLVEALTRRPDLLLPATADRLHQEQRAVAMPRTMALLHAVRAAGGAAVVSGAGPSVLVLGAGSQALDAVAAALASGSEAIGSWQVLQPAVDLLGSVVTDGPHPVGTTEVAATL
jgi:homoserine kinase